MNRSRPKNRPRSPLRSPARRTAPARIPSRAPHAPPRAGAGQPLAPQPAAPAERLQKLLAAAGLGSRRQIEAWIAAGRVTVGPRTARLGDKATLADAIAVDGRPVAAGGSG
ncbi:MAG: S4 domain-containing protein, partial [Betaproteobacteria bacterium]|nr:S4 domain-containing protein [Betaproteobacteria bacterium]